MGKKKNKGKPETGLCYNCGKHRELTKDHLPPKCLFARPRPDNLITVKACFECNNGSSEDDLDTRFMIATAAHRLNPREAQDLWDQTLETFQTKRPGKLAKLRSEISRTQIIDPVTGRLTHFLMLDARPYDDVFIRTARGFFHHFTGTVLPRDVSLTVTRFKYQDGVPRQFVGNNAMQIGKMNILYDARLNPPESPSFVFNFYDAEFIAVHCTP